MSEALPKELHTRFFHDVVTQSLQKEISKRLRLFLLSIITHSKEAVNNPELSTTLHELTELMSAEIIYFFNSALLYISSEYWKMQNDPTLTKRKELYTLVYRSLAEKTNRFENLTYIAEYEWQASHPSADWQLDRFDWLHETMDCWLALAILVENLPTVTLLDEKRHDLLFPSREFSKAGQN
jgi:hypothetical protein